MTGDTRFMFPGMIPTQAGEKKTFMDNAVKNTGRVITTMANAIAVEMGLDVKGKAFSNELFDNSTETRQVTSHLLSLEGKDVMRIDYTQDDIIIFYPNEDNELCHLSLMSPKGPQLYQ